MGKLEGKVCIVTGASGGIGKALVDALAGEGATLVLAARRLEVLEGIKETLQNKDKILCVKCDVTKKQELEEIILVICIIIKSWFRQ